MKIRQRRILEWAAIIAFVAGTQFAAGRSLPSGEPPGIAGKTVEGERFDLAQMRGRPTVLYFWASWCGICRAMQSSISAIAQDHPFISVAMQSGDAAELGKYMQAQGFQVPTLPDPDGDIASRYGLRGVPAVFVLGPDGKIRFATTGYTSEAGIRLRLWLAGL